MIKTLIRRREEGFTLVELLIVIALLAAIALIVIAAINPIEQANRARDTRFNTDAGQIVSATERFYAGQNRFPWVAAASVATNEAAFGFVTAGDVGVGICGASCSADGVLIQNEELKTEFRNRDFITNSGSSDPTVRIMVGKDSGSSASVYACYVPLSNATRQRSCADGDVFTISTSSGTRTQVAPATCASSTASWTSPVWYVCLPS